jgi:hypothetical protein
VTLEEVMEAYPEGIHPRDAGWIWRRILAVLGFAHSVRLVHGAVLPEHVMIHPKTHGLVLVDWCYSVAEGSKIPALVTRHSDLYPPEAAKGQPFLASSDIWMAAQCVLAVSGSRLPPLMASFAGSCLLPGRRRPAAAWPLIGELDDLLHQLFGPPAFHEFTMPARDLV